jgi:hypothetical protein
MKKLILSSILASLSVLSVPAQAAVVFNDSIDFSYSDFVPCAGEVVDLSGPIHILLNYTANDNNVSGKLQVQTQGISGVGISSGLKYQANGVFGFKLKESLINGQASTAFATNFRVIGQGPENNLLVHVTYHVTLNANGVLSSYQDNASVECK